MSIEVRNITRRFGDFVAVDDVSLEIPDSSLTAVLGPSGSGKSTLLRIIAGLERPDAGEVRLAGKDATGLTPQKRDVGFVFQHYAAFKHMTVRDNVGFALKIRKRPKQEIRERVDELLDLVQLNGYADRYPQKLSGGQRQRMALARALAAQPRVLLLDEPFGALDARVRAELRDWLRRLHEEMHVTTVFVTHDQEEAMEVADRVAVMNQARLDVRGRRRLVDPEIRGSVDKSVDSFLALSAARLAPRTVEAYRRDLGHLAAWLGRSPASATADDLAGYVAQLRADGMAATTIARRIAAIRSFFRHQVLVGARDDNPAAQVELPKRRRALPRTLSPGEVERILDAAEGPTPLAIRNRALVELLYGGGLRVSEAVGL